MNFEAGAKRHSEVRDLSLLPLNILHWSEQQYGVYEKGINKQAEQSRVCESIFLYQKKHMRYEKVAVSLRIKIVT